MKKHLPITLLFIVFTVDIHAQYNPLLNSEGYTKSHSVDIYNLDKTFQPKSESKATLLSILVPAASISTGLLLAKNDKNADVGIILVSLGIIIGPSAGNMYAQNSVSVIKGIGTRLLGSGITLVGGYFILVNAFKSVYGGDSSDSMSIGGTLMFCGGAVLTLYSTIYDIFNAPVNVKKFNQNKGQVYAVSPVYYAEYQSLGIAVSIRF